MVTSTVVPVVVDVVMVHGVAVPLTLKSPAAMLFTDSEKLAVNTGFKVPTVDPGVVIVAEGGVVSSDTVDDVESAAIELPA